MLRFSLFTLNEYIIVKFLMKLSNDRKFNSILTDFLYINKLYEDRLLAVDTLETLKGY